MKISVEKSPFFVEKLKIKILPCLVMFVKGAIVSSMVGFEVLGNSDDFKTSALEAHLLLSGALVAKKQKTVLKPIFGITENNDSSSDLDI